VPSRAVACAPLVRCMMFSGVTSLEAMANPFPVERPS
jgi:hypothetical protein